MQPNHLRNILDHLNYEDNMADQTERLFLPGSLLTAILAYRHFGDADLEAEARRKLRELHGVTVRFDDEAKPQANGGAA